MTSPGESNTNPGILDELAERLGNFHESACALAVCLQTRDITCMIEAAKCMFHKLLGEASDDLDRVTLQSREDLRAESTRNTRRCSRAETASEVFRSRSETISPSRGPLEHVADGDVRRQLELSVPLYRSGEWSTSARCLR